MSKVRLELVESDALKVLVLDEKADPVAGVPVNLTSPLALTRGRTGDAGNVVFSPLAPWYSGLAAPGKAEFFVRLDVPMADPVSQPLPAVFDPETAIQLTLPSTGALFVEVVDQDGAEVGDLDYLYIQPLAFEDLRSGERTVSDGISVALDGRSSHRFRFFGLGLRFGLAVRGAYHSGGLEAIDGPRARGEEVRVRVVCPRASRISACVVDEHGTPVRSRAVVARIRGTGDYFPFRGRTASMQTDSSGFAQILLGEYESQIIDKKTEIEICIADDSGTVVLSGASPLELSEPGVYTVPSPVVLSATNTLVCGQVVDDAGVPVAGALVSIEANPDEPVLLKSWTAGDPLLRSTSDADGRFEIQGPRPYGLLSVSSSGPDRPYFISGYEETGDTVRFEVGANDVVLQLRRTGVVAGTLVGNAKDLQGLSFGVHNHAVFPRFVLELPQGAATLRLIGERGLMQAPAFENVPVRPGRVTHLGEVLVEGGDHTVSLSVFNEEGVPVPRGWIAVPIASEAMNQIEGLERPVRRMEFENGVAILRADEPLPAFAVGAPGLAPAVTRSFGGTHVVVLKKAPIVSLVADLPEGCRLPEGVSLIARLLPLPGDPEWFRFGGGAHGKRGFGEVSKEVFDLVPGQQAPIFSPFGKVTVRVLLGARKRHGYSGAWLTVDPQAIEVREEAYEQVFHLRIDEESLARALAER